MKPITRLILCVVLSLPVCAQAAETFTLRVNHFLPAASNVHRNVIEPWCAQLEEESAGRLKCQIFPTMQLGGTPSALADMARNGVVDIVWTAPSYSAGKFPRVEALELPFVLPAGGAAGNEVIWEYYQRYAQDDFKRFKVLSVFGDAGMDFHTRNAPIEQIGDLAGLKLRISSRTAAETMKALKAAPVSMPPAQMTESIAKGVVDGALASWEVVRPTKLDEVSHYHSRMAEGQNAVAYTVLVMLMNPRKYDRLPADLQTIIDRNSGKALSERFAAAFDSEVKAAQQAVERDGGQISEISPALYEDMRTATRPVLEQWLRFAERRNIDGATLLKGLQSLSGER